MGGILEDTRINMGFPPGVAHYQIHLSVPLLHLHHCSLMRWHRHCHQNTNNSKTSLMFSFPSESVDRDVDTREINQSLDMDVCFLLPGQFHSKETSANPAFFLDSVFSCSKLVTLGDCLGWQS